MCKHQQRTALKTVLGQWMDVARICEGGLRTARNVLQKAESTILSTALQVWRTKKSELCRLNHGIHKMELVHGVRKLNSSVVYWAAATLWNKRTIQNLRIVISNTFKITNGKVFFTWTAKCKRKKWRLQLAKKLMFRIQKVVYFVAFPVWGQNAKRRKQHRNALQMSRTRGGKHKLLSAFKTWSFDCSESQHVSKQLLRTLNSGYRRV
jgi:hypothetical protein